VHFQWQESRLLQEKKHIQAQINQMAVVRNNKVKRKWEQRDELMYQSLLQRLSQLSKMQ
jgi:hypothetical protein